MKLITKNKLISQFKRVLNLIRIIILISLSAVIFKTFVVEICGISSESMYPTLQGGDYILVCKFSYKVRTPEYFPFTNICIPFLAFKGIKSVQRGDIVMFKPPTFSQGERTPWIEPFVKRCVGLPGDTIEIRRGSLYVNRHESKLFPTDLLFRSTDTNNILTCIPRKGDTIYVSNNTSYMLLDVIRDEGHIVTKQNDSAILIDGKKLSAYVISKNYYFMMGDNRVNSIDSRIWGFLPEDHLIGQVFLVIWSSSDFGISWYNRIRWNRIGNFL